MNVENTLDSEMGISSRNRLNVFLCSFFIMVFSSFLFLNGDAANTITQGQSVRDGETVVSENQKFELGFFSPANSSSRYVGIWYYNLPEQSVIWVANRMKPVSGEGAVLTIGNNSNLMVLDGKGNSVWSTNASVASKNSSAILMDTGNLVLLRSENIGGTDMALWQSFDEPTDTYVPDMRVFVNPQEGQNHTFTSWKSATDPTPGKYSMGIDPRGSPQIVIWEGLNRRWRSGHWNGLIFIGIPDVLADYLHGFRLTNEGNGKLYFTYTPVNSSNLIKFQIHWEGHEQQVRWDEDTKQWILIQAHPTHECDLYNRCGPFGKCRATDSPVCSCIEGFVPKNMSEWNQGNWSGGCVRRTELQCNGNSSLVGGEGGKEDGFLKIEGVKLPDFVDSVSSQSVEDCEKKCLRNCSCNGYGYVSGINCMIWSGDLVDVQHFAGGNTLYVRVANSELGGSKRVSVIIATVVAGTFFLSISFWLLWRSKTRLQESTNSWRKKKKWQKFKASLSGEVSTDLSGPVELSIEGQQEMGPELTVYSFRTIIAATNNFSLKNKLGQGGFGAVYKGKLPGGQEIAVKRLSTNSRQGLEEFKNETILIAKLQHRNLVRLLGCCIEGEERMLVYEYMPNKSLDIFLFDPARQAQLDWKKRFGIIAEIARGLIYLHRDSRLRIIHRDLKASNILLDEEMNPKISDFGLARIFGGNQNEASTNRVVGTYGYMSPEYAMEGLFSVKSDVYSFGVLLLEIISGRRNVSYRTPQYSSIILYAWDLWETGKAMDLIDPSIVESCCPNEVLRCIHVALLCVQDVAIHRPTMSSVLFMLETESSTLPLPRPPTLISMRKSTEADLCGENLDMVHSNDLTMTVIVGR